LNQSSENSDDGATVVITHRIRSDKHADYEQWLNEVGPLCRSFQGYLDWHIVRPIAGITETYTVIIRFDAPAHLKTWMASDKRQQLMDKVQHLFVGADDFYISSGLDFWFTPAGAKAKIPVRWRQYLLTWSAVFPMALVVPHLVSLALDRVVGPVSRPVETLAVTGVMVCLMVYVVMPRYTRLMRRWLFK